MVEDNQEAAQGVEEVDHNTDRYPTLSEVLERILAHEELPDVAVDRVEITTFANGEANCRWFESRAEEPEFIHLEP